MMAPSFGVLLMLLTMVGQTGNHLLDLASTEAYWKSKNVTVSVESMLAELKPPPAAADLNRQIVELASPDAAAREAASKAILTAGPGAVGPLERAVSLNDPQISGAARELLAQIRLANKAAQVRRLLAIRTLGELKDAGATGALTPLSTSPDPFESEYAKRALSMIKGQPYASPDVDPKLRLADALSLPADTRAVLQQIATGGTWTPLEKMLEAAPAMPGMPPIDKAKMRDEVTAGIVKLAEQIGDVRIDAVTAGLSGDPGPNAGFALILVRGLYDRDAVVATLRKAEIQSKPVAGLDVFTVERNILLIPLDNARFALLAGPRNDALPINDVVAALQGAKPGLAAAPDMKPLLDAVDAKQPLWGVAKMTDTYKKAPILRSLDTLSLTGTRDGATSLKLTLKAIGPDADGVKAAAAEAGALVQQGLAAVRQAARDMPALKPFQTFLESVKIDVNEKSLQATARFEGDSSMLGMGFALFGARARVVHPPAVAPPPEVKRE